jgi:hypothetical protein
LEDLSSALIERTDITTISLNMVYELVDNIDVYDELFIETSSGALVMLSVVPGRATFTQVIQHITGIRNGRRSGCAINVRMGPKVDSSALPLLQASYQPKMDSSGLEVPASQHSSSVYGGCDASVPIVEDTQIDFHVDGVCHADLQRRVTYSYPEYRSTMLEDSDITAYSDSEEDEI